MEKEYRKVEGRQRKRRQKEEHKGERRKIHKDGKVKDRKKGMERG